VIWLNVLVVVALVLVEALFVAAEISLVSLREGQVRGLADRGRRAQRVARLIRDPNRFLAAVQIGVTTTALISSAFGAVTLSGSLAKALRGLGLSHTPSEVVGFFVVTLTISYVTIVVGELVPKRLALQRIEGTAVGLGAPLARFAGLMRPVIWLLSVSTNGLVRLLGGDPATGREAISEEELRDLVTAHESLSRDERALIDEVFASGDRQLREVMVPRTEVEFLDGSWTVAQALQRVQDMPFSRYPVFRGSHDEVAGFVHTRDLQRVAASDRAVRRVADLARPVARLPVSKRVLPALSELRRSGSHLAVLIDEYGGTAGIVTLEDLIEEIIGEIHDEYDVGARTARRFAGGDVEVDGLLNLDEFTEQTGLELPDGPYETVAGCLMSRLGDVPRLGDAVEVGGFRLTVTAMDGRRAARVRVSGPPQPAAAADTDGASPGGATELARQRGSVEGTGPDRPAGQRPAGQPSAGQPSPTPARPARGS
jgi:putative hemolysin